MSKVPSIVGKIALLAQITALTLVQGFAPAPAAKTGVFNRGEGVNLVYYHRCGCPPEKVASRACCCYTGKCSSSPQKPAASRHSCCPKPAPAQTFISSSGCVEEYFGTSSGKFEFIGTSPVLDLCMHQTLALQSNGGNPVNFLINPPVPPPETVHRFQQSNLF